MTKKKPTEPGNAVTGQLVWYVLADCPHCQMPLALSDICDEPQLMNEAVFGYEDSQSDWDAVEVEFECPECKKEFTMTEIQG